MWLGKEDCKDTWQPEASIPPSIVSVEHGIQVNASVESVTYGGQTNHTLYVTKAKETEGGREEVNVHVHLYYHMYV